MTSRINKYLVGALLCTITHNGYSMEADKKGIDLIDSHDVQNFARSIQDRVNNVKKNSPLERLKIGPKGKQINFIDTIKPLINSDKLEEVRDAIQQTLQLATEDWKSLVKKANQWNAVNQLFNGIKIGKTQIQDIGALDSNSQKKILDALAGAPEYEQYMYKIDDTKTMEYLDKKSHSKVTNDSTILHDKKSRIKIQYKDKTENLENAIIQIAEDPLPSNRLTQILKDAGYKFFDTQENDSIIKYIAKALENKSPKKDTADALLNELYNTEIGAKGAAGEAIREYLQIEQSFKPEVKAKYEGSKIKLDPKKGLNEQLVTINNTLDIKEDDYTIGYTPSKKALDEIKRIQDEYKIAINNTNIAKHRFTKKNDDEIVNEAISKYMGPQLLNRLETYKKENDKLTQQTLEDSTKITTQAKENKALTDAKTKLEADIKEKEAEAKVAKETNEQQTKRISELEEINTQLTGTNEELKTETTNLKNYANALLAILDIGGGEDLDDTYYKIQEEVTRIKEGTPLDEGAPKEEIAKKDEEITNLKARINELELEAKKAGKGSNKAQTEQINKLTQDNNEKDVRIKELEKDLANAKKLNESKAGTVITVDDLNAIIESMIKAAPNNAPKETALTDLTNILRKKGMNAIKPPKEYKK